MELMICTDGSTASEKSAGLVVKLRFPVGTRIKVLGVSEKQDDLPKINSSLESIANILGSEYRLERTIRKGNPIDEIISEALESPCDLVVVGGGGKQLDLLHPHLGSTTIELARKLHTHFLVARNIPDEIRKILVCVGAEAPSGRTIEVAGKWIANTSAQIGLIHVVQKKPGSGIKQQIIHDETGETAQNLDEITDPHLKQAYLQLRDAGVNNEIVTRIKHGLVVDEVIKELSTGGYDLLVVGAHYQPGQDLWQETLLDDITDQLLNRSACSVLII